MLQYWCSKWFGTFALTHSRCFLSQCFSIISATVYDGAAVRLWWRKIRGTKQK